jgi:hypothetical protein
MAKSRIEQLREKNQSLKQQLKDKVEIKNLEQEQVQLSRQNKTLKAQLGRSPTEKAIRGTLKSLGKGFLKGGVSVGKGLMRYGRFLDERERGINRKIKTIKRRKTNVKTKRVKSSSKTRKRR